MMKIMYPDYHNCIVNLTNSVLKYYNIEPYHATLSIVDKKLVHKYDNIIMIVFDGMGVNTFERDLDNKSIMKMNKVANITSVFPSTTVAATTSLITGLTPMEHCWLGWDNYIPSLDKVFTMFLNTEKASRTRYPYHVAKKEFNNTYIFDLINNKNDVHVSYINPFEGEIYNQFDIEQMFSRITEKTTKYKKNFIYAYSPFPDSLMHEKGIDDAGIKAILTDFNNKVEKLVKELKNSLVIITADHGHLNVEKYYVLTDYPQLLDMLSKQTTIEPRAMNFFVKEEFKNIFKEEVEKIVGQDDFLILSKEEVIQSNLFGEGKTHKYFKDCLGDFLAISISDKSLIESRNYNLHKGSHAGLLEDEMLVPLVLIDSDDIIEKITK